MFKKKLLKLGLLFCLLFSFVCVLPVNASCGCKIIYTDGSQKNVLGVESKFFGNVDGCACDDGSGVSVTKPLILVINILETLISILAVIGITIAGIVYLTAGGNENQVIKAKKRLLQIVIGFAVFSVSWSLLNWFLPSGIFSGSEKISDIIPLSDNEVADLEEETDPNPTPTPTPTPTPSPTPTPKPEPEKPEEPKSEEPEPEEPKPEPETPTPTPTPSGDLPNSSPTTTFVSTYETGTNVNFLLYNPSTAADHKLPLIVYLHGDSGHGTTADALKYIVGVNEFSNWNSNGLDGLNAYILVPQTRTRESNWGNNPSLAARNEVWDKIKSMIAEGKVDPSRVSIMGQSRGSYGVQYFVTDSDRVGRFSAAALLSGYYINKDLSNAPPMKFIYGSKDSGPKSNAAYFRQYGADIKEYAGHTHDSVIKAALLEDANSDGKSDLLEWILSKTSRTPVQ